MYITISEAKQHLIIDADFCDDDAIILQYIQAAEEAVANHLDKPLKDCLVNGSLKANIKSAILLLLGVYYANREAVSYARAIELPFSVRYLLQGDRKFSIG